MVVCVSALVSFCCSCVIAGVCFRRTLMYILQISIICSSVGLGKRFLKYAISSADSGRCITLLTFLYLILMSSSVTSGVLCVVVFVFGVEELLVQAVVCSTCAVGVIICW